MSKFNYRVKQAIPHCQNSMVNIPIAYRDGDGKTMLDVKDTIRGIRDKTGLHAYIRVNGKKVRLEWNSVFGGFIQEGLL